MDVVQKWQGIVDLLAEIIGVPAALIMRVEPPNIKVFLSSESKGNPYEPDEVAPLNTGLYCETVMKTRRPLLVPDALADEEWKTNPDIKLGMISYLGFPVNWPNGETFGTICILDTKRNQYSELYRRLLLQCRDILQVDLSSLVRLSSQLTSHEETLQKQANLLDLSHDAIYVRDRDAVIRYWNHGAEELYGWTAAEALGKVAPELLKTVFPAPVGEINAQMARTGRWEGELVQSKKDGTPVVVASRWSWQRDEQGAQVATLVTNNDITDRKRAEQARQEIERRSERELRDVIETIPAMVWSAPPGRSKAFVNKRWADYTGLSAEQTEGSGWQAAVHPEDRDRHAHKVRTAFAAAEPFTDEVRVRCAADGQYRWFLSRVVPLRDEQGNVVKCYGILTDIEDRKRAEGLLAGEKRILEMVAKGDSLHQILDSLCRLVEEQASDVFASILLLDGNRLRHGGAPSLPRAYTDAIDGAAIGPCAGSCGTAAYRGEQVIVADIATDPLWAQYRDLALPYSLRACWSTPVFSSQGKVIATFAMYYREPRSPSLGDQEIIEQITHLAGVAIERKLTQDELQRSESYRAEAERLGHTGSFAWDPSTGKVLYCSEEIFRIYGLDPQQALVARETFGRRTHPEDRAKVKASLRKSTREKLDSAIDYRILLPDGTVKHLQVTRHPVLDKAGNVTEVIGTMIDVTERKRAEEELRAAESRFRTYVDHATDALLVHDDQGNIVDANRQACESLGYTREELLKMAASYVDSGVHSAFLRWFNERLDAGETFAFEASHRRKDQTSFPVEVRVRPFWHSGRRFALALARDITERERLRQLQADLAHINRVTTMGELTASLAHEVNQPIAAAVTDAGTCLRWLAGTVPNLEEAREAAKRTVKDAKRAAEIISRTRLLFKKSAPQRELIDLNEVISEMIALLRSEASRHGVSIRTELVPDLPRVAADRVQLQQVLMNLMINGIEAMKDVDSRRELTLTSRRDGMEKVRVSVGDTGVGLPSESEQIFDAFFTTKRDGTGLGLAISRSITESHGGQLWATSNSGRGAIFHLTLPTTPEAHP